MVAEECLSTFLPDDNGMDVASLGERSWTRLDILSSPMVCITENRLGECAECLPPASACGGFMSEVSTCLFFITLGIVCMCAARNPVSVWQVSHAIHMTRSNSFTMPEVCILQGVLLCPLPFVCVF